VPAVPVSRWDPVWEAFSALLPERPSVVPSYPLGCHRPRIPDRVVFEHVAAALVHGSGYERIASSGCSDRTIRRRVQAWAGAGVAQTLHGLILEQYDRMIGLESACTNRIIGDPAELGEQGRMVGAALPGDEALAGATEAGDSVEKVRIGGAGGEMVAAERFDQDADAASRGLLGKTVKIARRGFRDGHNREAPSIRLFQENVSQLITGTPRSAQPASRCSSALKALARCASAATERTRGDGTQGEDETPCFV
jgi:hypothetical protein